MRALVHLSSLLTILTSVVLGQDLFACPDCEVLTRDAVVVGGGSTGTYTALRLTDHNYSIAIVEPKSHLGGHAETYTTPKGWTIDIGVIVFTQIENVLNYFKRFDVPLVLYGAGQKPVRASLDYSTGEPVPNYPSPAPADIGQAFANYAEQLAKYPELASGWNLSYPLAADSDLLLPFGQFAAKYNLSAAMQTIFGTNQGYVPLLEIPTIYMFKYLNQDELNSFATGFMTTEHHNIQELYQKVHTHLGEPNVFLSSTVLAVDRTSTPNRVLIQTPAGRKLILARKIVITAPPTLDNLSTIDLTPAETAIFTQFTANGYYTGLLTNTSLPANFSAHNVHLDPSRYDIPHLPGLYQSFANPGAPDHIHVYYGAPTILPVEEVKSDIVAAIKRVQHAHGFPETEPQWAVFASHSPFNLMVNVDAVREGFYERLFELQGRNDTFWNGAVWDAQDSSHLWKWTDQWLVPRIVESLEEEDEGDGEWTAV